MPWLDHGIHSGPAQLGSAATEWIAGSSPAMTTVLRRGLTPPASQFCENKFLDNPSSFVLAREIPLLSEGPERADRHFSGAVGGAATEPRSGAGTAFPRRAPLGSNPGAGCCMAAWPDPRLSSTGEGRKSGRVGERITPRGAPGGAII